MFTDKCEVGEFLSDWFRSIGAVELCFEMSFAFRRPWSIPETSFKNRTKVKCLKKSYFWNQGRLRRFFLLFLFRLQRSSQVDIDNYRVSTAIGLLRYQTLNMRGSFFFAFLFLALFHHFLRLNKNWNIIIFRQRVKRRESFFFYFLLKFHALFTRITELSIHFKHMSTWDSINVDMLRPWLTSLCTTSISAHYQEKGALGIDAQAQWEILEHWGHKVLRDYRI